MAVAAQSRPAVRWVPRSARPGSNPHAGGGVDDAIWRSLPAYDLALPGDDAAPASGPPWRVALAVVAAFLCVAFVGGGLFVGALGLQAVSAHQAQTGTV